MAIYTRFKFSNRKLERFARLIKSHRQSAGMSQLKLAQEAFGYAISHCKVSRIERCAMPLVDAYAIAQMARVLRIPPAKVLAIDSKFFSRYKVALLATEEGFWTYRAL